MYTYQTFAAGKNISNGTREKNKVDVNTENHTFDGVTFLNTLESNAPNTTVENCLFIQSGPIPCIKPNAPGFRAKNCLIIGEGDNQFPAIFVQNDAYFERIHGKGVFLENFMQVESGGVAKLIFLENATVGNKGISAEHLKNHEEATFDLYQSTIECRAPMHTGSSGPLVKAENCLFLGTSYAVAFYDDSNTQLPLLQGCRSGPKTFYGEHLNEEGTKIWTPYPAYNNIDFRETPIKDLNMEDFVDLRAGCFA